MQIITRLITVLIFGTIAGCGGGTSETPNTASTHQAPLASASTITSTSTANSSAPNSSIGADSSGPTSVSSSTNVESSVSSSSLSMPASAGSQSSASSQSSLSNNENNLEAGRGFYDEQCLACHGSVGEGGHAGAINASCSTTNCNDEEILTAYLITNMPLGTPSDCNQSCAQSIAEFMLAGFPRENNSSAPSRIGFQCNDEATPTTAAMQRLTKTQFRNSLIAVASELTGNTGEADAIVESLWAELDELPDEIRPQVDEDLHGTFRRLNQTVSQSHVEAWFSIAAQLANELTLPHRITRTVPCYGSADINNCVEQTLNNAGRLILRRPINVEDIEFYRSYYRAASHDASAYADLFSALFNAPEFLYHIFHGSDDTATETTLAPHELANKLSYHLLDAPPDAQLRAAADNSSLLNDDIYAQQVARLLSDARAQSTTRNFYREWLKLENIEPLNQYNETASFLTFANGIIPEWNTHLGFMDEVLSLLDYGTWQQQWSINDLLSTQLILPNTQALAEVYNTPISNQPVLADNNSRPGLFTRPAFLVNAGINTRPIMKGVFLRHTIMCDDIPAPPDNATDDLPPLSPTLTTRERVEAITERPETACAFCHETLINGLGYATENYDALGRLRTSERIINNAGEVIADRAIDTSGVPQVTQGDLTPTNNAQELMGLIAQSGKVEACVARHYFRYTFGRFEDVQADACVLETMRTGLEAGSLQDLITHTVTSPAFKSRTFITGGEL